MQSPGGSEQVGLEFLAEAGERLGRPDMSRELIPPLRSQNSEELGLGRAMFGLSYLSYMTMIPQAPLRVVMTRRPQQPSLPYRRRTAASWSR